MTDYPVEWGGGGGGGADYPRWSVYPRDWHRIA